MIVSKTRIPGLLLIELARYDDERGFFVETYQHARYVEAGIKTIFVQDNHSHTLGGVLKGMHYTISVPQAMLVCVSSGSIFDVVIDLRIGSPTYGDWHGVHLSTEPTLQRFIPAGFAHGYCVTGNHADVHYKVSHTYDPEGKGGMNWRDPGVAIQWPIDEPTMIQRDRDYPFLSELPKEKLPHVYFEDVALNE